MCVWPARVWAVSQSEKEGVRRCPETILSQSEKVSREKHGFNKEVQLGQQVERPECCKRIGG